jgi:hypothetical protein
MAQGSNEENWLPSPYFRVGEPIPFTGIYNVFHLSHRVSHEVTLLAGEFFPRCSVCANEVHFELVAEAPQAATDSDFRVRLYEIPCPAEARARAGEQAA